MLCLQALLVFSFFFGRPANANMKGTIPWLCAFLMLLISSHAEYFKEFGLSLCLSRAHLVY